LQIVVVLGKIIQHACTGPHSFIHFYTCLYSAKGREGSNPRRTRYNSRAAAKVVLLAPHQDRAGEGRRYNHAIWPLVVA